MAKYKATLDETAKIIYSQTHMNEYQTKNHDELVKLLDEKRQALRAFRMGLVGGKVKNVKEGKTLRKSIAQILTAVNAEVK